MRKKNMLLAVILLAIAGILAYVVLSDRSSKTADVSSGEQTLSKSQPAQESELFVYTWADYIKPELVQRFEKENNCRVTIDTFDSNEAMYSKLKAGATGYDIITPSS